jgi:hypothetical protein
MPSDKEGNERLDKDAKLILLPPPKDENDETTNPYF